MSSGFDFQSLMDDIAASFALPPPLTDSQKDDLRGYVEAGCAWLDATVPAWAKRIDLTTFNVGDSLVCLLAQLSGSFGEGLVEYNLGAREAVGYGFFVFPAHPALREAYAFLTEAWRIEIVKRARVRPKVRAGAKLLDEKYPAWAAVINLATLQTSQRAGCILGQLYGGYDSGRQRLGLRFNHVAAEYGFYALDDVGLDIHALYAIFDEVWGEEVQARLTPEEYAASVAPEQTGV